MADENPSASSSQSKSENNEKNNPYIIARASNPPEVARRVNLADANQYDCFYDEMGDLLQPNQNQSFPISHDSKAAEDFERAAHRIVKYLDQQMFPWESINCMGRVNEFKQIRSTIVIGAGSLQREPSQTSLPELKRGIMEESGLNLPIEFLTGINQLELPFEFRQPSTPLVSGVSCGNVGKRISSGTIGGFIEHRGKSGAKDVYAVSNHHVFAIGTEFVSFRKYASRPKVSILLKTLGKLRKINAEKAVDELVQLWLISCCKMVEKVFQSPGYQADNKFHCLRLLEHESDFPETLLAPETVPGGDISILPSLHNVFLRLKLGKTKDKKSGLAYARERTYLESLLQHEFVVAVFGFGKFLLSDLNTIMSYWNYPPIDVKILDNALRSLLATTLGVKPSRTSLYLNSHAEFTENLQNAFSIERSFRTIRDHIHKYNVGYTILMSLGFSLSQSCSTTPEVVDVLKYVYAMHEDDSLTGLDNLLIEHPSRPDQKHLVSRVEEEKEESESSHMIYTTEEEKSRDISRLQSQLDEAKEIERNPSNQVIGYVWTSSGLSTKPDPRFGGYVREDWALVRLLPGFREHAKSTFDQNSLRPDFQELEPQSFTHARSWVPSNPWSRLKVSKRGRSSNYTVGSVNGARACCKLEAGRKVSDGGQNYTLEFHIISTPPKCLFSQPGDSGSWVMDKAGQLVGMMWGKLSDQSTAFTPGLYLLKWWKTELCQETTTGKENEEIFDIL